MPLKLNDLGYLETPGLNVMLAHDYYAEGHQCGVGIIQNGARVATNGDIRLEPTPGQWEPIPKVGERKLDRDRDEMSVRMEYPDESRDRTGFNPVEYPDLHFAYTVRVWPDGVETFRIRADLEAPLPDEWLGRVGFNLELFPATLFGKTFMTERGCGIFPRQAGGPGNYDHRGTYEVAPLIAGRRLVVAPESDRQRMGIEVLEGGDLQLFDQRALHNPGWFSVRSLLQGQRVEWRVSASVLSNFMSEPVIQVSQVGYHPSQPKRAVIELDRRDTDRPRARLLQIQPDGGFSTVLEGPPEEWGDFLRFRYLTFDFTGVRQPGMYVVSYGDRRTAPFRIGDDVFERIWHPTIEYFLPVQMCHMRVNESYRVWHGACHLDDARMAPTGHNHFDGYRQGPSTLCRFASGEHVPGLNRGGWHDAGDYDLRIESQADTVYGLALAYEEFGLDYDNTTVDQEAGVVELLRPDGKPDVLQQIEHGVLTIVGAYNSLGRLYRGIIEPTLRQYRHLGDAATITDNRVGSDDRWVFTEENPRHELEAAAALAASFRVLGGFNDGLAAECLRIAEELYDTAPEPGPLHWAEAALELLKSTGSDRYRRFLLDHCSLLCESAAEFGHIAARCLKPVDDPEFTRRVRESIADFRREFERQREATPYRIPYEPGIWGAGWSIQRIGVKLYWLHRGCPDIFPLEDALEALNFVLGCHPGPNTCSFVSGVGARSLIPAFGVNRADESFIPGGIASGTALIRPDLPELLENWPYLWQQTEYCLGYPTSDYVFLAAAAHHGLNR